ncbi:MAG: NADH-quinone oxidoreductase subunit L [Holosporales bacterium]
MTMDLIHPITPLAAPLLGFLTTGLFGRLLGRIASNAVTCVLMALAMVVSWMLFWRYGLEGQKAITQVLPFIDVGILEVHWGFQMDSLSSLMMLVVTTVSFLVHIYAIGYMDHDRTPPRFMAYLSLFTFMMLILVTGDNLVQLFVGWEGVGLASYLLIGYWYEKPSACAAAIKAFVVNRVGDLGLILAMGCCFFLFNSLNFNTILESAPQVVDQAFQINDWSVPVLEVTCLLLFVGAMGKSAQIGLHTWLPDAMEGPTPVSALIHAATMVTAGIFLVVRLSPLFELAPLARDVMIVVGATTAFFAGTIALTQNDIKRVIAYSTCSQLGMMFLACGVSAYDAAMFHLATHAFFKALLFLGAGAVIHALSDEQDMRKMGGIWRHIPVTYGMMWIGSLALAGIPFFAGYYSKHAILDAVLAASGPIASYGIIMGFAGAFLTAFYSWRLLYMTFTGAPRAPEAVLSRVHEPGMSMLLPLFLLSIGAVFAGYLGHDMILSQEFWQATIAVKEVHASVSPWFSSLSTILSLFGIGLATYIYWRHPSLSSRIAQQFKAAHTFLYHKWYFDEAYEAIFVRPSLLLGRILWKGGDVALIDTYGPNALAKISLATGDRLSRLQTGYVASYALMMVVGLLSFLVWHVLVVLGGS